MMTTSAVQAFQRTCAPSLSGRGLHLLFLCVVGLSWLVSSTRAEAAPQAHLLRIDPETTVRDGNPVITTLIDVSETTRLSQLESQCSGLSGDERIDCRSDVFERPGAFAESVEVPEGALRLTVEVDGADETTRLIERSTFGQRLGEPGVGTAYLVVLDADSHGKTAYDQARAVAGQFIESMGPGDWLNLMVLGPRTVLRDTGWQPVANKSELLDALEENSETSSSRDRTRPLLDLISTATRSAFTNLSVDDAEVRPPLHQALVVLSSGYGGGDPSTTGPGAAEFRERLTSGRLDPNNTALPRLPLPIVSLAFEPSGMSENKQLARAFMENLPNPEIGGFFSVLREDRPAPASRIVDAVRARFAELIVARFSLSCVAPSATQSFQLLLPDTGIVGDSSFSDVPVGINPHDWPLDLDEDLTRKKAAEGGGVFPGDTVRVFGHFCWGTDESRPEIYFIPPGEPLPEQITDEKDAVDLRKRLVALDMRGAAVEANGSFAEFRVPENPQILHGDGDRQVVRVVVVDTLLKRTSGMASSTILTLDGRQRPLPVLWIALATVGGLFLLGVLGLVLRITTKKAAKPEPRQRTVVERSPYATPAPVSRPPAPGQESGRVVLEGEGLRFVLLSGSDLRVGRDGSRCAAVVDSPQVSGLHATFRLQGNRILVRDEGSTSGTRIDGRLIRADTWESVPRDATVALGPKGLLVRWERESE